jgi:hypothetical protein
MAEKEVVQCVSGPYCHEDQHGWDCPMSNPMGDMQRMMMDWHANAILEQSRRALLREWFGVEVEPLEVPGD